MEIIVTYYEFLEVDFEISDMNTDLAPSILKHEEWAVGVNYWFNANFVIKASYHNIKGNRFALPDTIGDVLAEGLDDTTHLYVVGTQFSF